MLLTSQAYIFPGTSETQTDTQPIKLSDHEIFSLIKSAVEIVFGLIDLNADNKCKLREECVYPRQIAHALTKHYTRFSLKRIGILVGGKDHATVLYSVKKIDEAIENYNRFRKDELAIYYDKCLNEFLKLKENAIIDNKKIQKPLPA